MPAFLQEYTASQEVISYTVLIFQGSR